MHCFAEFCSTYLFSYCEVFASFTRPLILINLVHYFLYFYVFIFHFSQARLQPEHIAEILNVILEKNVNWINQVKECSARELKKKIAGERFWYFSSSLNNKINP